MQERAPRQEQRIARGGRQGPIICAARAGVLLRVHIERAHGIESGRASARRVGRGLGGGQRIVLPAECEQALGALQQASQISGVDCQTLVHQAQRLFILAGGQRDKASQQPARARRRPCRPAGGGRFGGGGPLAARHPEGDLTLKLADTAHGNGHQSQKTQATIIAELYRHGLQSAGLALLLLRNSTPRPLESLTAELEKT